MVLDFDIMVIYDITLITPYYKYAILCKKKWLQTESSQLLQTNISSTSSVNHEQGLDYLKHEHYLKHAREVNLTLCVPFFLSVLP